VESTDIADSSCHVYIISTLVYVESPVFVYIRETKIRVMDSGAGTNLKVGGHRSGAKCRNKKFLALKVQLVVLVSAFVMVSIVWSVSCLVFFCSRCPLPCSHL